MYNEILPPFYMDYNIYMSQIKSRWTRYFLIQKKHIYKSKNERCSSKHLDQTYIISPLMVPYTPTNSTPTDKKINLS